MNIDWGTVSQVACFVLIAAGSYWFARPEKKRDVGAQIFTASSAWLGSACVFSYWAGKIRAMESWSWEVWVAMLLSVVVAYLAIGSVVWWLLQRFVLKR